MQAAWCCAWPTVQVFGGGSLAFVICYLYFSRVRCSFVVVTGFYLLFFFYSFVCLYFFMYFLFLSFLFLLLMISFDVTFIL